MRKIFLNPLQRRIFTLKFSSKFCMHLPQRDVRTFAEINYCHIFSLAFSFVEVDMRIPEMILRNSNRGLARERYERRWSINMHCLVILKTNTHEKEISCLLVLAVSWNVNLSRDVIFWYRHLYQFSYSSGISFS